jgi:hypothetical protein
MPHTPFVHVGVGVSAAGGGGGPACTRPPPTGAYGDRLPQVFQRTSENWGPPVR